MGGRKGDEVALKCKHKKSKCLIQTHFTRIFFSFKCLHLENFFQFYKTKTLKYLIKNQGIQKKNEVANEQKQQQR